MKLSFLKKKKRPETTETTETTADPGAPAPFEELPIGYDYAYGKEVSVLNPPDAQPPLKPEPGADQSFEVFAFSKTINKALMREGFETVRDLQEKGPTKWSSIPGIGPKGAETIVAALASWSEAPTAEPEPVQDDVEVSAFDGLIVVRDHLQLFAPHGWTVVDMPTVINGIEEAAVFEFLRTVIQFKKVVLRVDDVEELAPWCEKYHVVYIDE